VVYLVNVSESSDTGATRLFQIKAAKGSLVCVCVIAGDRLHDVRASFDVLPAESTTARSRPTSRASMYVLSVGYCEYPYCMSFVCL